MKKEIQIDERGYRKYGMRDSLAYAAGDFGCNMSFAFKGHNGTFLDTIYANGFHFICFAINSGTDLGRYQ